MYCEYIYIYIYIYILFCLSFLQHLFAIRSGDGSKNRSFRDIHDFAVARHTQLGSRLAGWEMPATGYVDWTYKVAWDRLCGICE